MDFDSHVIDAIIARHGTKASAAIPILQETQRTLRYLPISAIEYIATKTGIPAAQLYGVATFYTQFRLAPVGEHIVKVCHGTACHVAGAEGISEALGLALDLPSHGGTSADKVFTLESVACLGCCSLAPVVMVDDEVHGNLSRPTSAKILDRYRDKGRSCACADALTEELRALHAEQPLAAEVAKIVVGTGSCGNASGAQAVMNFFALAKRELKLAYEVAETGCIGMCHREPLVEVVYRDGRREMHGHVDVKQAKQLLIPSKLQETKKTLIDVTHAGSDAHAYFSKQQRIVLEHCGRIDPEHLEEYEAVGGYESLRKVLQECSPEEVIAEVTASGLRGRGGAGFLTGRKWQFARSAIADQKYIICNADEGDPGAFMDRSVLESDPHRVIEGMAIAAYAIGASEGYIYCRAEYPLAVKRLNLAIEQAMAKGFLGGNILGSGFSFRLAVKEGAGAFVCGEETAMIASIEGRRGMPRVRPPFPAQSGLFGKPTNINNVETYANVPWIIQKGASAFASLGTTSSKGTKVFALAGDIARGGLVEVPMGITLREVVEEIGGGTKSGKPVKAVQLGGPSGGCLPAHLLDTAVDYEQVGATGAIMGSGGMVVMDTTACMVDIARFFLAFTQEESCGKCTFCRIGTRRMLEILTRITEGEGCIEDLTLLEELCHRVKDASLCGLGQTAPNPVLTTLTYFRDEYEAHVREGKCPAGKCRALITFAIAAERCIGCGKCVSACPTQAIAGEKRKAHHLDQTRCTKCGACKQVCPVEAVDVK